MPAWWLPFAVKGGTSVLGKLLGMGDKGGLTDEDKRLLQQYWRMYEEGLPAGERAEISAPYYGQAREIKQRFAGQPGSSAKSFAVTRREALTPMTQALESATRNRQMGLLGAISGITGRAQRPTTPTWGETIAGIGGMGAGALQEEIDYDTFMETLNMILGKEQPSGLGLGGGGLSYSPGFLNPRLQRRRPVFG